MMGRPTIWPCHQGQGLCFATQIRACLMEYIVSLSGLQIGLWMLLTFGVLVILPLSAYFLGKLRRFGGEYRLFCPRRHTYACVHLNALGAAWNSLTGRSVNRIADCDLKGSWDMCDQDCLRNMEGQWGLDCFYWLH